MAEAPGGDEILTESDAVKIMEELTEALANAHRLGLMLKIKPVEVEAIYRTFQDPKEKFYQIILAFLRQAEPPPTWRAIVNALKSPIVNLTALAKRVEAAHFPDPTASRDPPTTSDLSYLPSVASYDGLSNKSEFSNNVRQQSSATFIQSRQSSLSGAVRTLQLVTSSAEVKMMINILTEHFNSLKNTIRECLERQKVRVARVVDVLTSLSPDEDERYRIFVLSNVSSLYRAASISEVFGVMNCHWNYLDPSLLQLLVKKIRLVKIKDEVEAYNSELKQFKMRTPLNLFCQAQKKRRRWQPENFQGMVAEFDWPENVTLEDVEQFQQNYASEYSLYDCAMIISQVMSA